MKKIKTVFTMLAAAVAMFLLPEGSCMKAAAEEPVTYAVKYMEDSGEWRYQSGSSSFNDEAFHRELYYMYESMKDGDIVVVYNRSETSPSILDLGSVHLQNLTVVQTVSFTSIKAGNVDNCYALAGTSCGINANVDKAYVYDNTLCNFDANVGEINITVQGDALTATVGCSGTVNHVYAYSESLSRAFFDLYDFKADSLLIKDGKLQTAEGKYSSAPAQAPAPTPAPQQPAAPSAGASNDDEYDEVPKTGESHMIIWLLCLAGACGTASYGLRKADKNKR